MMDYRTIKLTGSLQSLTPLPFRDLTRTRQMLPGCKEEQQQHKSGCPHLTLPHRVSLLLIQKMFLHGANPLLFFHFTAVVSLGKQLFLIQMYPGIPQYGIQ